MNTNAQRTLIKQHIVALFSGQRSTLWELRKNCEALLNHPAIATFLTPLPWIVTFADASYSEGYAENLRAGVSDILGMATYLLENHPPETVVYLTIDESRLQMSAPKPAYGGAGGA